MTIKRFKIKYRKLRADPLTALKISEADPEQEIRLMFEVRIVEALLDEWEGVTNLATKINLGDTVLLTGTTTVGMLERFEEDDDVIFYEIQRVSPV